MFAKIFKPLGAGLGRRAFSSTRPAALGMSKRNGILAASGVFAVGTVLFTSQSAKAADAVDYTDVRKAIASILEQEGHDDGHLGPLFVRLAWHASGTYDIKDGSGGSNGATMRFAPESNWGANAGLGQARDILEHVKARFPGITYGDLWTLAAVEAIEDMGGPKIGWRSGRVDAKDGSKIVPDGRLPDAAQGASHLRDIFYKMGMNDQEIVALSGAHSLGRCHADRSGFSGPWTRAPTTFSNLYFQELLHNKWTPKKWNGPHQYENPEGDLMMLPTDLALLSDPTFRKWVEVYAQDEQRFAKDFAKVFQKLTELGVPASSSQYSAFLAIGALAAAAFAGKK